LQSVHSVYPIEFFFFDTKKIIFYNLKNTITKGNEYSFIIMSLWNTETGVLKLELKPNVVAELLVEECEFRYGIHLKNIHTNQYLSALDNNKHIYWSDNKDLHETFTIDDSNKLVTAFNTYMSDTNNDMKLWQVFAKHKNDTDCFIVRIVHPDTKVRPPQAPGVIAFKNFMEQNRKYMDPNLKKGDITRKLNETWKQMSKEERMPFYLKKTRRSVYL